MDKFRRVRVRSRMTRPKRFWGGWLWLLAAWALVGVSDELRAQTTNTYQLEAMFLSEFSQFTDWPADAFSGPRAPMVIGVLGKDPFGTNLEDAVRGQKVNNHPLQIQHFRNLGEIKACQILYISNSETKRLPKILSGLKGRSILTVSDDTDFAMRGGMVSLLNASNKMQLQVNLEVLNAARLTMSSKLLRTADIVTSVKK